MRAIAIVNQKGGTAKTTTAREVSAALAAQGYRVAALDLDGQADLTGFFLASGSDGPSVVDVLEGRADALGAMVPVRDGLDVLPATDRAYLLLSEVSVSAWDARAVLDRLSSAYDFAVIDFPRAVSTATLAMLAACDLAVIPTEASRASAEATVRTLDTLGLLATAPMAAVLLVRHNERTRIGREYSELIEGAARNAGARMLDTHISLATAVPEAEGYGLTLSEHRPSSKPALEYRLAVVEMLELLADGGDV